MISRKNKDTTEKKLLFKKEYENPQTTESASSSSGNVAPRRRRGISLSKEHSINFDRIYASKDLVPDMTSSRKVEDTEENNEKSRISSKSKSKMTIHSAKSEKHLGLSLEKKEQPLSRIAIGSHRK